MYRCHSFYLALALPIVGCHDDVAQETTVVGGTEDVCPAGFSTPECVPPGVPPDRCGDGFEFDDAQGCRAILPEQPCGEGQMALPGDTACHEVAPCGDDRYPPVGGASDVEYVDAGYTGGNEDGSPDRPWSDLLQALTVASAGATIALAAGTYGGVSIAKPVVLIGRCPAMVTVTRVGDIAIELVASASGSTVRGIAVTGSDTGIVLRDGAVDVRLVDLWIHDLAGQGIYVLPHSEVSIDNVLIDAASRTGVFGLAADLHVERIEIRNTMPDASDGTLGRGLFVKGHDGTVGGATLALHLARLERNRSGTLFVKGAAADIDSVLVRTTLLDSGPQAIGLSVDDGEALVASEVSFRRSVIEDSGTTGIFVSGSNAVVEDSVVRDSGLSNDPRFARAISAQHDGNLSAQLTVRRSLVERARTAGILMAIGELTVEETWVRDIEAGDFGAGSAIVGQPDPAVPAGTTTVHVWNCIVDRSRQSGLLVFGGTLDVANVAVRDTQPSAEGLYGDGIAAVIAENVMPQLFVDRAEVSGSARAGLYWLSAAVELGSSRLECNTIHLDGEESAPPSTFVNRGDNYCGCAGVEEPCKVLSSGLEAPRPLGP